MSVSCHLNFKFKLASEFERQICVCVCVCARACHRCVIEWVGNTKLGEEGVDVYE